jgi:DNA (cytosine-5)-methyltransferase 1
MIRKQFILDINGELVVDGFAGGGGASTGIERALGRHVDHAMNHDDKALGMHRINHPQTVHHCEDIFAINPARLTEGRRVGAGWFSPDCKHFSKAKGGKPLSKKIRGLAFVIFRWAAIRTRVIYMENVEEIQTWGPLLKNGKPDPKHRGRTFNAFVAALGGGVAADHPDLAEMVEVLKDDENQNSITREQLIRGFGYQVETRELRACDYGAPTIRKRLFMVARCDGLPIVWPKPTHAAPEVARKLKLKPWRAVAECIDWSIPCNSIFMSKQDAKRARCIRPLAAATLRRIAKGVDRYVLKAAKPFIVSLTHQGGDNRIESIDEPANTITGAQRGEKAFIDAAVAPFVNEHANATHQRTMAADEPLRTICASVKGGHFSLAAANLIKLRGYVETHGMAPDLKEPLHAVSAGGTHHGLVAASLVQTGYGEAPGQKPRALDIGKPLGTIVASGKHAVVSAHLIKFRGDSDGASMDKPAPTITAGSVKKRVGGNGHATGLATASIVGFYGNESDIGSSANEPFRTATTKEKFGLVSSALVAYYGNDKDGQALDEPCRTVTTKERFGFAQAHMVGTLTMEQYLGALRVAAFLREHGVEFEGMFATVQGFVIWDLGMRMLISRELFSAQGFTDDYVIDQAWLIHPKTGEIKVVTLTKTEQVRMCGNSVSPPVAEALVAANSSDLSAWQARERKSHAVHTLNQLATINH